MEKDKHVFSDVQIWYSEKKRADYIFCKVDGKEMPAREITPLDVQKVKDGVLTQEELAERVFKDSIKEPLQAHVEAPVFVQEEKKPDLSERLDNFRKAANEKLYEAVNDVEQEIPGTKTAISRLGEAMKGLAVNVWNAGNRARAWIVDMAGMAAKRDTEGMNKELEKVRQGIIDGVKRGVEYLRIEDGIQTVRNYGTGVVDAVRHWFRGEKDEAKEALQPLVEDVTEVAKDTKEFLEESGIAQMAKNTVNRVPQAVGAVKGLKDNPEQAKAEFKEMFQEVKNDVKNVLRSEPVKGAVKSALDGIETVEEKTRLYDSAQQEKNRMSGEKAAETHDRLSSVTVYKSPSGLAHYVRCKIDGEQQMAKRISEQDFHKFEMGTVTRLELAEKYYAKDLKQNMSQGNTREQSKAEDVKESKARERISDVTIYKSLNGRDYFVRCQIDGRQQMGYKISAEDYRSFKAGNIEKFALAEKYYANDLAETVSRTMSQGMKLQ